MSNITRPLQLIESEIVFYIKHGRECAVEIGKRLIEAKGQLQHGEWGNWLYENFDYSQDNAEMLMKLAREYPNSDAVRNLGVKKASYLTMLPQAERAEFMKTKHDVNGQEKTVEEMTTRELHAAIKAKKEAEKMAETLQMDLDDTKLQLNQKDIENRLLVMENNQLKNKSPEIKEITVEKIPDDYELIKKQVIALADKEREARQEAQEAKKEALAYKTSLENAKSGGKSFEAVSVPDFKQSVRAFLQQNTPLIYLGEIFSEMDNKQLNVFYSDIELIERWIIDFKQALDGKNGGANLIILEGGK